MVGASTFPWKVVERWSPRLYLIAGAVLAVYAALNGVVALTDMAIAPNVFQAGYIAGFLGLLGLYPGLADQRPWLARAGAGAAALGVIAFSVFTASNLAELIGIASGNPTGWGAFAIMGTIGFVVGYLAVGIVVIQSEVYSRAVGLLLLMPGVIIILMFASMATGVASPGSVFVVSAGQAMTHLAIGSTLKVETASGDRKEAESSAIVTVEDSSAA